MGFALKTDNQDLNWEPRCETERQFSFASYLPSHVSGKDQSSRNSVQHLEPGLILSSNLLLHHNMSSWAMFKKADGTYEFRPATPETARRNYEENLREHLNELLSRDSDESEGEENSSEEIEGSGSVHGNHPWCASIRETSHKAPECSASSSGTGGPKSFGMIVDTLEAAIEARGRRFKRIDAEDSDDEDEGECFRKNVMTVKSLKTRAYIVDH
jgi:hypothetical protein